MQEKEKQCSEVTGVKATGDVFVKGDQKILCQKTNNYYSTNPENTKPRQGPLHSFPTGCEFFYGRDTLLKDIHSAILLCEEGDTVYKKMVVITGFGGMGKSEIAKVLAKKLQSKYDLIFWFDAQTKASLDSGFRMLAALLKIYLKSEDSLSAGDIANIYLHLADNYSNGIFIFDNVEVLKTAEGQFGLEDYLEPELRCQKPVFVITSRNPWGDTLTSITCIQVQGLTDDDSYTCFLKYLRIDNIPIPESLKEAIQSLVHILDGHALGISLLGSTLAGKADKISLRGTESKVRSYMELLREQSIEDLSGQPKYEARLQIIVNSTIEKIEKLEDAEIAIELLDIIRQLPPDNMYIGLVDAIYSGKSFVPVNTHCQKFLWDDATIAVKSGLKILLVNSLIIVPTNEETTTTDYDSIKIHRLVQQSIQNRFVSTKTSPKTQSKIMQFFERNGFNSVYQGHILYLLESSISNPSSHWEALHLLALLSGQFRVLFLTPKLQHFLRTMKLNSEDAAMLYLFQAKLSENMSPFFLVVSKTEEEWSQIINTMLKLSPRYATRHWVIELCANLLTRAPAEVSKTQTFVELRDLLIDRYIACEQARCEYSDIFRMAYLYDESHRYDWSQGVGLVRKIFDCTCEHQRGKFWEDVSKAANVFNDSHRMITFFKLLFPPNEINIFAQSLSFRDDGLRYSFLNVWSKYLLNCVILVVSIPDTRELLLGSKEFKDSFWDITDFGLKHPPPSWEHSHLCGFAEDGTKFCMDKRLNYILGTWCTLFVQDTELYGYFGPILDAAMEAWLEERDWFSARVPRTPEHEMLRFLRADHCTERSKYWIRKIMIVNDMSNVKTDGSI